MDKVITRADRYRAATENRDRCPEPPLPLVEFFWQRLVDDSGKVGRGSLDIEVDRRWWHGSGSADRAEQ